LGWCSSDLGRQFRAGMIAIRWHGGLTTPVQPPHKVSDRLHPLVQKAAAGLLIWFVVAAWLLFGSAGYIDLALAMVSVLVFMAIAIPWAIWCAGAAARRRDRAASTTDPTGVAEAPSETFAAWLQGHFVTWTEQKSSTAIVEVLLPPAAVAFGLTAIGIVFQLTHTDAPGEGWCSRSEPTARQH
jgi:hypothetical protein